MLGQNVAGFARPPGGGGSGGMGPSLDLNFLTGILDNRLTFTRTGASNTATRFDSTGTLQPTNTNTPRFDYGSSGGTTPLGLLIEETRTNSIRNPRAEGASAGTPGTTPTNWQTSATNGVAQQVVGTGTENGIPYIDLRVFGTTTGTGTIYFVRPEPVGGVAASPAQIWVFSSFVKLAAGSLANISSITLNILALDSGNTQIGGSLGQTNITPTNASLASQRTASGASTMPALTASVLPQLLISASTGLAIDATLRIGIPQLELGSFATYPIMPVAGTPAAATRGAEVVSGSVSSWYNFTAGSYICELMTYTIADPTNQPCVEVNDGTTNNRTNNYIQQPRHGAMAGTVATVAIASTTANSLNANVPFRIGGSYSGSGTVAAMSGSVQSKTVGAANPSGLTTIRIGTNAAGSAYLDGWIRRVRYYPRELSAAELIALTT